MSFRAMRADRTPSSRLGMVVLPLAVLGLFGACGEPAPEPEPASDLASVEAEVEAEVEAAVWALHAANTAVDAERVAALLWPDYEMLVDGRRLDYDQVVEGSREFMATVDVLHATWSDLRIIPLSPDAAVSSFLFRDSIVTRSGELIENRGPTTLLWERRGGEWRMKFGDADHYPVDR